MFYATLVQNGEKLTARFYSRAARDQFIEDHKALGHEAGAIRSKKAKFVPGATDCVTFASRHADGWRRV